MKSDRIRHEVEQEFYPDGQMKRHRELKEPIYNDFLINLVGGMLAIAISGTLFAIIYQLNYGEHNRVTSTSSLYFERSEKESRV